jgi:SAM-dependent methyltransferase
MSFVVSGAAYDRFMGRYSRSLAPQLAELAGIEAGQRVLDVGSGPGALTAELVARLGASAVVAVDPSAPFVDALRERLPDVEAARASAEALPFGDGVFDAALAQLVVHFMADPVAGLREMARVTRPGGVVAACVWDHAGERSPLAVFWRAAHELDPGVHDESGLAGARAGALADLLREAGLQRVVAGELEAAFTHANFDEWWEPFTLGVGPAGHYVAGLDEDARTALSERCRELLPGAPRAVAWAAAGIVG